MSRLWTSALLSLLPLTAGCADGLWQVETWGEDYVESGIPSADFADGCSATFSRFTYALTQAQLLDGDGQVVGALDGAYSIDIHAPGPHTIGGIALSKGLYEHARFRIAPSEANKAVNLDDSISDSVQDGAASISVAGEITCGDTQVYFDWDFATDTTYLCEPQSLSIGSGAIALTQLTIHGDHFFYDGLEDPEANLRGEAIVQADANGDGQVTLEELSQVSVAPLGYSVGRYSEVEDLAAFITHLSRTVGHVDGEGHCSVDL